MEEFRDIEGYEGLYQVSNLGRVKSFHKMNYKILKNRISTTGYFCVLLTKNTKSSRFKVHRLVAKAFISNPKNKKQVNHKNGIKTENIVHNLEWNTASENIKHAFKLGLRSELGSNNNHSKLTEKEVLSIRRVCFNKISVKRIAKIYGVHPTTITSVVKRKCWIHI